MTNLPKLLVRLQSQLHENGHLGVRPVGIGALVGVVEQVDGADLEPQGPVGVDGRGVGVGGLADDDAVAGRARPRHGFVHEEAAYALPPMVRAHVELPDVQGAVPILPLAEKEPYEAAAPALVGAEREAFLQEALIVADEPAREMESQRLTKGRGSFSRVRVRTVLSEVSVLVTR